MSRQGRVKISKEVENNIIKQFPNYTQHIDTIWGLRLKMIEYKIFPSYRYSYIQNQTNQDYMIRIPEVSLDVKDGIHCLIFSKYKDQERIRYYIIRNMLQTKDFVMWKGVNNKLYNGLYYHVVKKI